MAMSFCRAVDVYPSWVVYFLIATSRVLAPSAVVEMSCSPSLTCVAGDVIPTKQCEAVKTNELEIRVPPQMTYKSKVDFSNLNLS